MLEKSSGFDFGVLVKAEIRSVWSGSNREVNLALKPSVGVFLIKGQVTSRHFNSVLDSIVDRTCCHLVPGR